MVDENELQEPVELVEQEPVEPAEQETVEPVARTSRDFEQETLRREKAEMEAAEYRRLLMDIQQSQLQSRQPQVDPDEERRQVAMMDVDEQVRYYVSRGLQAHGQELQRMRQELLISQDKTKFDSTLNSIPEYNRYKDRVEQVYQDQISKNAYVSRDMILSYLVGQSDRETREKSSKVVSKAKRDASENLQRSTTRPSSARSGVSSSGGEGKKSASDILKERLESGAYNQ
jgi:hypothetical protein